MQEECAIERTGPWRCVGKRSATHPYVTDRPLKRFGKGEVIEEKTLWIELVVGSSKGEGEGLQKDILRICDRAKENGDSGKEDDKKDKELRTIDVDESASENEGNTIEEESQEDSEEEFEEEEE